MTDGSVWRVSQEEQKEVMTRNGALGTLVLSSRREATRNSSAK